MICGIDFGSRRAGTTAICWNHQQLQLACAKKGGDADQFLIEWVEKMQPSHVFIDAPLSIPSAIIGKGDDYMYRRCDRDLQAMSPMFLGGLTARAIRLKDLWQMMGIEVLEVYPAASIRFNYPEIAGDYKKDIVSFILQLKARFNKEFYRNPINWHEVDAVLAWEIGYRYQKKETQSVGMPAEGLIHY